MSVEIVGRSSVSVAVVLVVLAAGCANDPTAEPITFQAPETGIEYEPAIRGAPSPEIEALMEQSLLIYRRQEGGAQSAAFLRRRAQGDVAAAQKILRSFGYYEAQATPKIIEAEGDNPARAEMVIEPGRPFELSEHRFALSGLRGAAPTVPAAAELGSPVGETAAASQILAAEGALVARLRGEGHPYAAGDGRTALADPAAATLEVESRIAAGPAYVFGAVTFAGVETVEPDYLLTYLPWELGDRFDATQLRDYQRALLETGLFRAGAAEPPGVPPEGENVPIFVRLEEAKHRTVSAGVRFSTDAGPAVRGGFEHRNLFGANETLNIDALAGLEEQSIEFRYREPQYLRPGQDLTAGLSLRRITDDAFDELGATATLGLERELTPQWLVGAGILGEVSQTEDEGETELSLLAGLPVFAEYDGSDDLLNPTEGARFRADVTPFAGSFAGDAVFFLLLDAVGSAYHDFLGDGRYVLAGRARAASIVAEDVDDVPPQRRLYSGGGGSVRGFAERFVGPLDDDNDPVGGLSALEGGIEMRARVFGDIGLAVFAEAGSVSEETIPDFEEGVQVGVGVGLRYFSPVGPIRLDFAVPLDRRDADDSFQFYISIGQAF
ncbi:MAG: BamA/TamA family outer membrane protein [Pseudomonadota bacterium]